MSEITDKQSYCSPSPAAVRVEKLVSGGDGLGHLEDGVVFVPYTVPGDVVTLKEVRRRRGVRFAVVHDVIESSTERRVPPCPWFGNCGGCQWMHMEYETQVHWKKDIFRQTMRGIARIQKLPVVEVHRAPDEYQYRFRARLHIHGAAMGFFRRASGVIVSWDRCMILPEAINKVVSDLRTWLKKEPAPTSLVSCEIALSPVDDSMTLNWIFTKAGKENDTARKVMDGAEAAIVRGGINLVGQSSHGPGGAVINSRGKSLPLQVGQIQMVASPGSFFQVNPRVNETLVGKVLDHLGKTGARSLLDLYCGNGNFSLPCAAAGMRTVGVESSGEAVLDAASVSKSGSRFVKMDVQRYLEADSDIYDAVIMDPPRTGLSGRVAKLLSEKSFSNLIYISCEPSTLARDLARLGEGGYTVENVDLFDMFPQTPHFETMVVLKG